jgi:hypothetical protein
MTPSQVIDRAQAAKGSHGETPPPTPANNPTPKPTGLTQSQRQAMQKASADVRRYDSVTRRFV